MHQEELARVDLPPSANPCSFDHCAEVLAERLERATSGRWLSMPKENRQLDFSSPRFHHFARWIRAVQRHEETFAATTIITLNDAMFSSAALPEVIGRISWFVPLPKGVGKLLAFQPSVLEPEVVDYPVSTVARFKAAFPRDSEYRLFVSFYKTTVALTDRIPAFRRLIMRAIAALESELADCAWPWGYSRYGWEPVDPRGWPHWPLSTPLTYATEDLRMEWIHPNLLGTPQQRQDTWTAYMQIRREFTESGLLSRVDNEAATEERRIFRPPLVSAFRIELDEDVLALIEDMLLHEAAAEIAEVKEWLKLIAAGREPLPMSERLPVGSLVLESERAYLLNWRRDVSLGH